MNFNGDAWKVSPSDLTFLYEGCPRCFWLKVAGGFPRPRAPFPKIFSLLDSQTKEYFRGKRSEDIAGDLHPGRVIHGDRWVRSGPITVPGHDIPILLGGRFDTAIQFDDGSYGIIDFKTTDPREEHVRLYGRQLHAYALAAENPAPGSLRLHPVVQLGLLCVEPVEMARVRGRVAYCGEAHWLEIPRDDGAFLAFLSQVLFVLQRTSPPDAAEDCTFCQYVTNGSLALLTSVYGTTRASGEGE